jgi:2-iminobutanoate/2-iminopropanoate deaminase
VNFIFTDKVPAPGGHYSQAVQAGGFTFVSGMLPGPGVAVDGPENFARQVRATLQHCERVLEEAGCTLTDVVQCTAYIVDVNNWPEFNRLYAEHFGTHKPARAVVPVPELHHGFLVELQMIAYRGA